MVKIIFGFVHHFILKKNDFLITMQELKGSELCVKLKSLKRVAPNERIYSNK